MLIRAMTQAVVENKITTAASILTASLGLIAGIWAFDAHYAKAADLDAAVQTLSIGQKSLQLELRIQLNRQTLRDLQSKVDDLDDKLSTVKKVDPVDLNKKKRLEQNIDDLKNEITQLQSQKFQVENPTK